jgi:hypothetical protein
MLSVHQFINRTSGMFAGPRGAYGKGIVNPATSGLRSR